MFSSVINPAPDNSFKPSIVLRRAPSIAEGGADNPLTKAQIWFQAVLSPAKFVSSFYCSSRSDWVQKSWCDWCFTSQRTAGRHGGLHCAQWVIRQCSSLWNDCILKSLLESQNSTKVPNIDPSRWHKWNHSRNEI